MAPLGGSHRSKEVPKTIFRLQSPRLPYNLGNGEKLMKKLGCALVVVVSLILNCLFAFGESALGPIPPIPEKFKNIQIIKPDPSVPKEIADFSGEWEGVWKFVGGKHYNIPYGTELRRAKFLIYEVSTSKVKFIYGVAPNLYSARRGSWIDYSSDIRDFQDKKYISFMPPSGYALKFHLEDGLLKGVEGGKSSIEMKRIK
jgi:hypothetical protein